MRASVPAADQFKWCAKRYENFSRLKSVATNTELQSKSNYW